MDATAVEAAATARMDAYAECLPLLPDSVKFDATMAPIDWRKAAIAAHNKTVNLDDKSADFVNGMFEIMRSVGTEVVAKTDAAKTADFRRVLEGAAVGGDHSGASLTRDDSAEFETKLRADEDEIHKLWGA
jgi:hypothetical protein